MSGPGVLERCRMALAEIGEPAKRVTVRDGQIWLSAKLTPEQHWMLRCTTLPARQRQVCLPCFLAWHERGRPDPPPSETCGAWRPFQRESCGAQP